MSNRPNSKQRPDAKAELKRRPAKELKFTLTIEVPEAEGGGRHQIDVDLMSMSLSERQLAKRALAKMESPDYAEVTLVHAWVAWRRDHPTSSLQVWMDDINLRDITDGIDQEPGHVAWDTTPEGFDPNP